LGYWIDQINASLSCAVTPQAAGNRVDFTLELPQKDQPVLLVADDHAAAIQLIQRYLQDSEYKIVGVQDPDQILLQARRLHPSAVLLDVMMPSTDGWEILQTLKADPTTANTPVLIYSVWHEPELAFSLGAAGYLKKPFNQQDLVQALAQLHPADSAGGADPAAV
jgi:CheY-like chemotaxis protein